MENKVVGVLLVLIHCHLWGCGVSEGASHYKDRQKVTYSMATNFPEVICLLMLFMLYR